MKELRCCLCGKKLEDIEDCNNPWPFRGDACCHSCNMSKVIPERTRFVSEPDNREQYERVLERLRRSNGNRPL